MKKCREGGISFVRSLGSAAASGSGGTHSKRTFIFLVVGKKEEKRHTTSVCVSFLSLVFVLSCFPPSLSP